MRIPVSYQLNESMNPVGSFTLIHLKGSVCTGSNSTQVHETKAVFYLHFYEFDMDKYTCAPNVNM